MTIYETVKAIGTSMDGTDGNLCNRGPLLKNIITPVSYGVCMDTDNWRGRHNAQLRTIKRIKSY